MDVSVIIINYNTFQLTSNCIRSIIEKTIDVTYEIILVDNASTECDADEFKKLFPQIQLIKSESNLGFSKGNNLGIKYAKGDFILLLNSDTEFRNNAIHITLQSLLLDEKNGVVTARVTYPDGTNQHVCQKFPSIKKELIELFRLHKFLSQQRKTDLLSGSFFLHETIYYPDWIWGTYFMFPKSILKYFPDQKLHDQFFMYFEDLQWCYFIRKLGYEIIYNPDAVIIHYNSGSTKSEEAGKIKFNHQLNNEIAFMLQAKGKMYTRVYFFMKSIKYLSLYGQKQHVKSAKNYIKMAISI